MKKQYRKPNTTGFGDGFHEVLNVKNNGNKLFFNHSDPEAEDSMKDNWLSLKKR